MPRISVFLMLPSSLAGDPDMAAAAKAIDEQLSLNEEYTESIIIKPNIDEQPENIVDNLAWEFHVDFYEPLNMDLATKRELVKLSPELHAIKGTPAAVEKIVAAAFDEALVEEWFDYGGLPYFFRVTTTDPIVDADQIKRLVAAIYSMKNTRSWLDMIAVLRRYEMKLYWAGGIVQRITTRILPRYAEGSEIHGIWHFVGLILSEVPVTLIEGV